MKYTNKGRLAVGFVLLVNSGCRQPEVVDSTGATGMSGSRSIVTVPSASAGSGLVSTDPVASMHRVKGSSQQEVDMERPRRKPEIEAARDVAASWLSALAIRDTRWLQTLSAPSLSVIGFWLPSGAERAGCGDNIDRLNELSARVADGMTMTRIIECVARDPLLKGNIPEYQPDRWLRVTSAPDPKGRTGYLKALDLSVLEQRLERYREPLLKAGAGSAVFTFFATDGGGGTSYGVITVVEMDNEVRVENVFIDEMYEP